MQKHSIRAVNENRHNHFANASAPHTPLRRLDLLFSQISQLGLDTIHLKEQYWSNRRRAVVNLLQELTLVQRLYEGSRLEIGMGDESIQTRAMELNAHLIRTADFGNYVNAEKVNILYQLRRAVERIYDQHFGRH